MASPSRPLPRPGMVVGVVYLGGVVPGTIEEVRDEGRTLIVEGQAFTLRRLTGHFVLEHEPYYGTRLSLLWQAPGP